MHFSWLNLAIALFVAAGVAFAAVPLLISRFVSPRARGGDIQAPYECGMPARGTSAIRFAITYYFYALIFIAFDVDVLYLLPAAIFYPESQGWLPFVELTIFIVILGAAILYFRKKGVFTWPRKIQTGS